MLKDASRTAKNVLGTELIECCLAPITGFYRNGYCQTGPEDFGVHTVCIFATDEFLAFSKACGNDLSTPHPQFQFPGLKAGDRWCLCAARWLEAFEQGKAPGVFLESTHEKTLEIASLDKLKKHAVESFLSH